MTNFIVSTISDELAENTNLQDQTSDGDGLSLREAVALANSTTEADTVFFGSGIQGQIIDISLFNTLSISEDLTFNSGVVVDYTATSFDETGLEISNGAAVVFSNFVLRHMSTEARTSAITVIGDGASLTNDGIIVASGTDTGFGDRAIAIRIQGTDFTLVNEFNASIITEGRRAIDGVTNFNGGNGDSFTTVVNHGLIQGPDDGVSITTGVVTNSGTIRSTFSFDFGGNNDPGITSDAIQFWGAQNEGYITPAEGQGVVNNLATGIIEGGRSAIFLSANGTVNNDGLISSEGFAILNNGADLGSVNPIASLTINNTGTITNEGFNFSPNFQSDEDIVTIRLTGSPEAASIDINNSGTISGPGTVISIENGGATVNNEAGGEILSDKDNVGNDGIAFRGAQLEDFTIPVFPGSISPFPGDFVENTQGITVDNNGLFMIPALGTSYAPQSGRADVVFIENNTVLPLVDLAATQSSGFLTFQSDANGLIFAATIDIVSSEYGTITVEYLSGSGFTITDANGEQIFDVPQDVNFADTILNAGLIDGDVLTGLGDDVVTNTGTILGEINLGGGDDVVTAGAGNNAIFGGTGDDILEGGGGADALNGGEGVDTASYEGSTNRIVINLAANTATSGHASGDTFVSIENLTGSNFGDVMTGNVADNVLLGGLGRDVLSGFTGDDTLDGGAARDFLTGGAGADMIDGGDDLDMARYVGSNAGVNIDLGAGTASGGHAEGDVLTNIEQLFGSSHADTLTGDAQNNFIFGSGGDDTLDGAGGIDKLFGGTGADTFVFGAGDNFTFVTDWEDDVDSLDLSQYGFSTVADALANMSQFGAHVRFFVNGETLLILNADLDEMADDIIVDGASV